MIESYYTREQWDAANARAAALVANEERDAALAAAEARGRQQMIDALRDEVAFMRWLDRQPQYLNRHTVHYLAAAYLDSIAKEGANGG